MNAVLLPIGIYTTGVTTNATLNNIGIISGKNYSRNL